MFVPVFFVQLHTYFLAYVEVYYYYYYFYYYYFYYYFLLYLITAKMKLPFAMKLASVDKLDDVTVCPLYRNEKKSWQVCVRNATTQ